MEKLLMKVKWRFKGWMNSMGKTAPPQPSYPKPITSIGKTNSGIGLHKILMMFWKSKEHLI